MGNKLYDSVQDKLSFRTKGLLVLNNTVKPLLSGHLRDLPKCPLNKGFKNCAMFVNDQHSTVTLYRNKVACC